MSPVASLAGAYRVPKPVLASPPDNSSVVINPILEWDTDPSMARKNAYMHWHVQIGASEKTLIPPAGKTYWGALVNGLDTYGAPYSDAPWNQNTWNLFEADAKRKVSIMHYGAGLAPWDRDFNYHLGAHNIVYARNAVSLYDIASQNVPLRDITAGLYDAGLTTFFQQVAAWGHPIFIRWNFEMNGNWFNWGTQAGNPLGNTAAEFVSSWQRVHDIAVAQGATNIKWVWCPNTDFAGATPLSTLYPGDAYVDWMGFDAYNKNAPWTDPAPLYTPTYNILTGLSSKPIMIAETGCQEVGGSKAAWITSLFALLPTLPQIRALVWFNWHITAPHDWQIESSPSAQAAFAAGISSPSFVDDAKFADIVKEYLSWTAPLQRFQFEGSPGVWTGFAATVGMAPANLGKRMRCNTDLAAIGAFNWRVRSEQFV